MTEFWCFSFHVFFHYVCDLCDLHIHIKLTNSYLKLWYSITLDDHSLWSLCHMIFAFVLRSSLHILSCTLEYTKCFTSVRFIQQPFWLCDPFNSHWLAVEWVGSLDHLIEYILICFLYFARMSSDLPSAGTDISGQHIDLTVDAPRSVLTLPGYKDPAQALLSWHSFTLPGLHLMFMKFLT